ncbi:MAG: putative transposase, partial [Terracoccus sp.]
YGLDTILLEAVLRTLAGQPRAEGATRIDPTALGRVLGLDRAPEVKTIRRKLGLLAAAGKADRLIAAMAATHLARPDTASSDSDSGDGGAGSVGVVLYVDGHVRAYQGRRKVGKTHLARLRFPAPATLETWVSDAAGDPVLVVMAQPGASLAGELRRLVPELRAAVGDERRVLVGFDRGGWSPALFQHLDAAGFDVLTWRKGPTPDIDPDQFTDLDFTDETGRTHAWRVADTTTTLPLSKTENATEGATGGTAEGESQVFTMRQITLAVPVTKHAKKHATENGAEDGGGLRQIHILTTRTDLPPAEIIYRMGSRWRQENYFRYARMHFDLDSHDSYAAVDDDPERSVPNPARKHTYQQVLAARARHEQQTAATHAALLAARSPAPGTPTLLTNQQHDALTADLRAAEAGLTAAEAKHEATPARLPLREVNPGQQVLDVQTKLLTHAIRIAAFNTATTLASELRLHTSYARKNDEAHTLIRQVLTGSGDIDPTTEGVLTIRLDPLPTRRATTAIKELCEHLTTIGTRYPGTDLTLRYEIKTAP